jgi:hypothetical protein
MPIRQPLQTVILPEKKYRKLYEEAFKTPTYTGDFTKEMHRAEFDQLDRQLRMVLSARWDESAFGDKDFAMMDEGEAFGGWHHCGGIYSPHICCPEYVEMIMSVLTSLPHASLWTYHTACETWQEDSPLDDFGEFFIRDGTLCAPKDLNDYARVFGRQKS